LQKSTFAKQVFKYRRWRALALGTYFIIPKLPSLKWKPGPKQLLGYLLLAQRLET